MTRMPDSSQQLVKRWMGDDGSKPAWGGVAEGRRKSRRYKCKSGAGARQSLKSSCYSAVRTGLQGTSSAGKAPLASYFYPVAHVCRVPNPCTV